MKSITLGLREIKTQLPPCKRTCISKTIGGTKEPITYYRFSSAYDECNYLYNEENGLDVAIENYEKDTRWKGFKFIEYYTYDEKIKLEWEKNVPF